MFKKTGFLILAILFFVAVAFAGQIKQFVCDYCGFKSSEVFDGVGKAGIEKTIIYCPSCKDFYSISTKKVSSAQADLLVEVVNPRGRKRFMGKARLVYPCPVCNGDAYAYDGRVCPVCKKGKLKTEIKGDWD